MKELQSLEKAIDEGVEKFELDKAIDEGLAKF